MNDLFTYVWDTSKYIILSAPIRCLRLVEKEHSCDNVSSSCLKL